MGGENKGKHKGKVEPDKGRKEDLKRNNGDQFRLAHSSVDANKRRWIRGQQSTRTNGQNQTRQEQPKQNNARPHKTKQHKTKKRAKKPRLTAQPILGNRGRNSQTLDAGSCPSLPFL